MTTSILNEANHQNVRWLLTTSLRRLILLGLAVALGWYGYLGFALGIYDLSLWPGPVLPLLVMAIHALSFMTLSRFGYTQAVIFYTCGMTLMILLTAGAYSQPMFLAFLALPAGAVTLLVGPVAGICLATVFIFLSFGIEYAGLFRESSSDIVAYSTLFISLTTTMVWIATYPLRIAIDWSWESYERARKQTEQTREHRAKLLHITNELERANERLKIVATELERARQAANIARRLKAEFAANISHELRTPLNLIIGFSEMMVLAPHTYDTPLPPEYRADVQTIYRNAMHLSNLIDDVLDLSQIEAGRMGLVKEDLNLETIIDEAIAAVSQLFHTKHLYLTPYIPERLPVIEADRVRIRQVLINLLTNAARYTEQGGVTITATANEQDITVSVADTGIGIDEADLPLVFQEFRQLDGAVQHHKQTSGLGLSISKKFIEMHGGRMWVTSVRGEGTTFYFRLPRSRELAMSMSPPGWETWVRLAPGHHATRVVAILDDERTTARFFERYLDGYRVISIKNVDELRYVLPVQPMHAVIATAPSGDMGWIRLRHLRDALPSIPILVCTLRGGPHGTPLAGVHTYLVKPVSEEKLRTAISSLESPIDHVLLVDDEPEVVRLLTRMLQATSESIRISRAFTGAEAIALLQQERPDVIILDLLMPDIDGYSVLTHLQAEPTLRAIPVIVVSAKGLEEEVFTAGLVGVTRKDGFSVGEMMRSLKANLDALTPPLPLHSEPEPTTTTAETRV